MVTTHKDDNFREGETMDKDGVNADGENGDTEDPSNLPPSPKRLKLDEGENRNLLIVEINFLMSRFFTFHLGRVPSG